MAISLVMHHRLSLSKVQHSLHVSGSYVPLKKVLYFHCFCGSAAARDAQCLTSSMDCRYQLVPGAQGTVPSAVTDS